MDDSRIIGKLEEHARSIEKRFDTLESKVDGLVAFRWKTIGWMAGVLFVLEILRK